jgi:hypothetical protein
MPKASRPHMPGYGLTPSVGGHGLLPFFWAEERLARSRNFWLSTVRPDGAMALWGVWLNGAFWFNTGSQSREARNLAEEARCVVTTEGAEECVVVEGSAVLVGDAGRLGNFFTAYEKKYEWDLSTSPEPTFELAPKVVFGFCEKAELFLNAAMRWTFRG